MVISVAQLLFIKILGYLVHFLNRLNIEWIFFLKNVLEMAFFQTQDRPVQCAG